MTHYMKFKLLWIVSIVSLIGLCCTGTGMAQTGKSLPFVVRMRITSSPILSGDAGQGIGAPKFDDVFETGYGCGFEGEYKVTAKTSIIGGVEFERYAGKTFQNLKFSDLKMLPLYIGYKRYFSDFYGIFPYFTVTGGVAHMSSVDVSWHSFSNSYWRASWVFTGGAGIGFNLKLRHWLVSWGIDLRYTGAPDNRFDASDAGGMWSLPICFGISYSF